MHLQACVYRALNPVWSRDPLSGEGALRHGGRFNPRGMAALYTSFDVQTALAETAQVGRPLQPTTLVSYDIDVAPVFDGTDPVALAGFDITPAALAADDWRLAMRAGEAPTQAFARRLIAAGFAGLRVSSFARTAPPGGLNLVLWRWGPDLPARVGLNDTDGRLNPQAD